MRAPWTRSAVLTAAALAAAALSVGCKTDADRANDTAAATIQTSSASVSNGQVADAQASLEKLASQSGLSPASKIGADTLLAKTDQALADEKVGELQTHQTQMASILLSLERLASQVATNDANVTALTSLNPTAGQQAFNAQADAAEKGNAGAWVPGTPPIPSQADAKQKSDDVEKQIKALTDQRTQLAAKRAVALESATKLSQQADSSSGQESVSFFIQGANQRKEARLNEIKIQDLDAQILPLQQQFDVLKAQADGAGAAAASSRDQGAKLAAGWDSVQKQIEAVKDYSKNLIDGTGSIPASVTPAAGSSTATSQPGPAQTIVALATQLDQETKAAADARQAAVDLLDKANKLYEDAAKQAETLLNSLPKSGPDNAKLPERRAWDDLRALHAQTEFKLGQAAVLSSMARIYAGQFVELQQRTAVISELGKALKQSGLDTPAQITALGEPGAVPAGIKDIQTDLAKADFSAYDEKKQALDDMAGKETSLAGQEAVASTRADLYFSWSDSLNNDVINGASAGDLGQLRTNLAHLAKMNNDYSWYQIASAQGQNPAQRLGYALTERRALEDPAAKGLLPSMLPPELSGPAATQPAAPGTPAAAGGEAASQPAPAASDAASQPAATTQPTATQPAGQ